MSVASLRSELGEADLDRIRVTGGVALSLVAAGGQTRLERLAEADGWRVRFPRSPGAFEAALVNTGGGIAGGDRVRLGATLGCGARAAITSATAERIYRALTTPTRLDVELQVGAGARLTWLPQETILHAGARVSRRVTANIAEDARLTLGEIIVFGRRAMPEVMTAGKIDDHWRLHRGGRLVHAELLKLEGDIEATLRRRAVANGGHVVGTLLHLAPDAADHLDAVRAALAGAGQSVDAGASAWDGKLIVRVAGRRSDHVRGVIGAAARVVTGQLLPRTWSG